MAFGVDWYESLQLASTPKFTPFYFSTQSLHLAVTPIFTLSTTLQHSTSSHLFKYNTPPLLNLTSITCSSPPSSWPTLTQPFPNWSGWMAMLLGSARGNCQLFTDYMEIANRYSSVQEMVAVADVVRDHATQEEKNNMHRVHGVTMPGLLPIDILLWAMKEADAANPQKHQ
ncbi:hypothetical protein ZWY2020_038448 [Hordeum vulgare]|nr:hypothetical protein ZWY2020_038448 [Hordeum vulgare]